jgi:hypothetical protein
MIIGDRSLSSTKSLPTYISRGGQSTSQPSLPNAQRPDYWAVGWKRVQSPPSQDREEREVSWEPSHSYLVLASLRHSPVQ